MAAGPESRCDGCELAGGDGGCRILDVVLPQMNDVGRSKAVSLLQLSDGSQVSRTEVLSGPGSLDPEDAQHPRFSDVANFLADSPFLPGVVLRTGKARGGRTYAVDGGLLQECCDRLTPEEVERIEADSSLMAHLGRRFRDRKYRGFLAEVIESPDETLWRVMPAPQRAAIKPLIEVCKGCVAREPCLEYTLANGEKFGIWGGLSERERRRVRRQRSLARRAQQEVGSTPADS